MAPLRGEDDLQRWPCARFKDAEDFLKHGNSAWLTVPQLDII